MEMVPGPPNGEEEFFGYGPELIHLQKINLDWDDLNAYEKLSRKGFEEGIKNSLLNIPPTLTVTVTKTDVMLTLTLAGLGDGDNGPCWHCSLKRLMKYELMGESESDATSIAKMLIDVAGKISAT